MSQTVYIRMKKKVSVNKNKELLLKDIAHLSTAMIDESFLMTPIATLKNNTSSTIIIDGFTVIQRLQEQFSTFEFSIIGDNETIVQIKSDKKQGTFIFVAFVWLLLFVGTAMTIINFHYDVSMLEVHQKIHYIFTGNRVEHPFFIQIPYSIGLGVGMVLFLNYIFKKKLNEEPSPLEVEIYKYEKDLNDFAIYNDKKANDDTDTHLLR